LSVASVRELFENEMKHLELETFDEKKIRKLGLECRLCRNEVRIESALSQMEAKISGLTVKVSEIEKQLRLDEAKREKETSEMKSSTVRSSQLTEIVKVEVGQALVGTDNRLSEMDRRVKELDNIVTDMQSQVKVSEIKFLDENNQLHDKLDEALSRVAAIEISISDVKQWPTPSEAHKINGNSIERKKVENKSLYMVPKKSKLSFGDKYKTRPRDTVLVIGDSLVRGIGKHLERDSNMFSSTSVSGARIEEITEKLKKTGDKPDTHLVAVVGTNNLVKDGTEVILDKYSELIRETKQHKYRKVSLVSIMRRNDLSSYNESKRVGLNIRIRELCTMNSVGFIDRDLISDHLSRDELHLSESGQDEVARTIFRHCKQYLN